MILSLVLIYVSFLCVVIVALWPSTVPVFLGASLHNLFLSVQFEVFWNL